MAEEGGITLRPIPGDRPGRDLSSPYEDWGPKDPASRPVDLERWLVLHDGVVVGDLSAHGRWYGPTAGSRAMSIGISIDPEFRGRGYGAIAQRLLAELLHERGIVRVEASTDIANLAEQRALEKAGFAFEGILRGAQVRADGRHDLQLWSHLP